MKRTALAALVLAGLTGCSTAIAGTAQPAGAPASAGAASAGAALRKPRDGSTPVTDAGEARRIAEVRAPVPQPASSQRRPPGTASHRTNSTATLRLHLPTYAS